VSNPAMTISRKIGSGAMPCALARTQYCQQRSIEAQ
jgi:hypothetical protein